MVNKTLEDWFNENRNKFTCDLEPLKVLSIPIDKKIMKQINRVEQHESND